MIKLLNYITKSVCYHATAITRTHNISWFTRRHAIVMIVILQVPSAALSQTSFGDCVPPQAPYAALSPADLAEFRAELAAEFEDYFNDLSQYITCLDNERARTMTEGAEVANAYEIFLNALSNDENN